MHIVSDVSHAKTLWDDCTVQHSRIVAIDR
jgi:hypothetical protein